MAHPPSPPGALLTRRAALAFMLGATAGLALAPRPAAADFMCTVFGDCDYESPGFQFVVTDRETGRPLADVHALAEWIMHGRGGRRSGPLMVQDAVSGDDGAVKFPPWGPVRGAPQGLVINSDPLVTLFRLGYRTLLLNNAVPLGTDEKQRVRGFQLGIQSGAMEPFRGTSDAWVEELRKAVYHGSRGSMSFETQATFRTPYLERMRRVLSSADDAPAGYRAPGQLLWDLERDRRRLQEVSP